MAVHLNTQNSEDAMKPEIEQLRADVQRLRNALVDIGVECTGTFDKRAVAILALAEAALGKSMEARTR